MFMVEATCIGTSVRPVTCDGGGQEFKMEMNIKGELSAHLAAVQIPGTKFMLLPADPVETFCSPLPRVELLVSGRRTMAGYLSDM